MAVQVGPNSTPVPGAGSIKEIYPELGVVSKYGEGATLVPGSAAEALALSTGATLTPVVAPVASGAPIIDKSFPAPETPEPFTPSSIIDTAGEVLGGLTGTEIAGGLLVGSALMGGAAEPEMPAEPAPRVYDPRGFDVKLDRGTAIDVAGTPIPVINFSRTTPVEQGGLPSGTRPAGDFLPLLSFDASAAPTAQGLDMRSVNLPAPDTSFFIDPVTGQITAAPTQTEGGELAPAPTPMREGGLAAAAKQVANAGRGGDTMLAHITPEEAGVLKALGGAGTINPRTGLPEFFIDKLFKAALPVAAGYLLGPAGAGLFSSGITAGLTVGGITALSTGSFEKGLSAGLGAYGGFGLSQGVSAASAAAAEQELAKQAATSGVSAGTGTLSSTAGGVSAGSVPIGATTTGFTGTGATGFQATAPQIAPSYGSLTAPNALGVDYSSVATGLGGGTATSALTPMQAFNAQVGLPEYSSLYAGTVALPSAIEETEKFKAQQAEAERKRRERLGIYENLAQRTLGGIRMARSGGLMSLAGGGMTYMEAGGTTGPTGVPRDVTGTGDGMSDSVPATIEGVQEARLADGEFVIPADVVADIGNGSSDAGSKKLYDMMDRIRKARHGTTKQPPEINAEALMPA